MNLNKLVLIFLLSILLVVCSYYFFDTRAALLVRNIWMSNSTLSVLSADLPDLLFPLVCTITGIAWTAYLLRSHKAIFNVHTRFFQLVAVTVPLAFFLKSILKQAVGRIDTRFWLSHPGVKEFHWLHGGGNYDGFPSGHMTVFTVLIIALWNYYPRHRAPYIGFLSVLALSLIVTDYHFISDIIAGASLGFSVHYLGDYGLTLFSNRREAS